MWYEYIDYNNDVNARIDRAAHKGLVRVHWLAHRSFEMKLRVFWMYRFRATGRGGKSQMVTICALMHFQSLHLQSFITTRAHDLCGVTATVAKGAIVARAAARRVEIFIFVEEGTVDKGI